MKILYVSHLFLPRYTGGTEVLTFQVTREMQRRGYAVEVLTCEDFRSATPQVEGSDEPYGSVSVHRLRLDPALSPDPVRAQYHFPAVEDYLLRRWRAQRPDLVHVHHFGFLTTAVATAACRLDIPVVFTATDFWLICPTSQLLRYDRSLCDGPTNLAKCAKCVTATYRRAAPYQGLLAVIPERVFNWAALGLAPRWAGRSTAARGLTSLLERAEWNRRVARKFARLLMASRFMQKTMSGNGISTERMVLLPFGLDTAWAGGLRPRRFKPPLRIGFIGAISPHKGLHVLVEAFRQLGAGQRARLEIYGQLDFAPPYGEHVRERAAGTSAIRFCGTFPPHEIGRVLSELDVLVIPSLWYENTPLVLLSALAARLPVIVSDMGGLVEIIRHGENGLVVSAGDPAALAAALQRCLEESSLLPDLSDRTSPVKSIGTYGDELQRIYEQAVS